MRQYTRGLMAQAHEKGSPVIRPCFYEFPQDPRCWEVETQYMYGDTYLVVPILAPEQRSVKAYLPKGATWKLDDGQTYEGGQDIELQSPLDTMPVLTRQAL